MRLKLHANSTRKCSVFPPNSRITLKTADRIVHFIRTHSIPAANERSISLFGMTREELAGFIERNRDMLPTDAA